MLEQALAAATDIYKENARIISVIEDKAQKAAGLAGVFLAAAFAFLRKDSLTSLAELLNVLGLVILTISIVLMLACVSLAAWTLWASEMKGPPNSDTILENVDARLAAADGLTDASRENNLREQARAWNEAIATQCNAIAYKSKLLIWTQGSLLTGVATVFALLMVSIFAYGSAAAAK